MRAVKRRDTGPELALRKALRARGLTGYRVDWNAVPGRPDIAFTRHKLAVFVDGGFWHGRGDRVRPGRSRYWDGKIARNCERDWRINESLETYGWRVLRLWDDEVLRDSDAAAARVDRCLNPMPVAEFFAGIGLVRTALESAGFRVLFANDIEKSKFAMYRSNFSDGDFVLGDVRDVRGIEVPNVSLATASFPCTDLSLAGWRRGLAGEESGMFWEFARVLREMDDRRPKAVMLENVPSFATANRGEDLRTVIAELNELGYSCDVVQLDARWWVPQSRPRVFVVGYLGEVSHQSDWRPTRIRPAWVTRFVSRHRELKMHAMPLREPPNRAGTLSGVIERLSPVDSRWWDRKRINRFIESLSQLQMTRLASFQAANELSWRSAYRRTRRGHAVWEVRADEISGCLRTARGGSSRQALVEAGQGILRVRWMTPREYARLMGVPEYSLTSVSENQALFGLGDAVCVPAVAWLANEYLAPLVSGALAGNLVTASP
jgi:DNA (cytosine-5)-methyltransferase 1